MNQRNPLRGKPMRKAVILDIDGTIATPAGRVPWEFDEGVLTDEADMAVVQDIKYHINAGVAVIVLSARPFSCEQWTLEWLYELGIEPDFIYLRDESDPNPMEFKKGTYLTYLKGNWDIVAVYEDDRRNIDMFRRFGLNVIDCGV